MAVLTTVDLGAHEGAGERRAMSSDPAATSAQVAIVTGGGSGIGLAIGQRLAAEGMRVAVFDRDGDAALAAAGKIEASGGTALGLPVDVTDRAQIDAGMAQVVEQLGPPTVLVNNAGVHAVDPFLKITPEKWQRVLDVNLNGTFNCCQAVVPAMVEEGWGRIVNISSSSAHSGQQYMAHYVAAKAGVIGLTKSLALELRAPKGITVSTTIPPGFIDTPMLRRQESKGLLGEGVEHHEALTPVRRIGQPEDIAALSRVPRPRRGGLHHGPGPWESTVAATPEPPPRLTPLPPAQWPKAAEEEALGTAPPPDREAQGPQPPEGAERARRVCPLPRARLGVQHVQRSDHVRVIAHGASLASCSCCGRPRSGTPTTCGGSTWPAPGTTTSIVRMRWPVSR